MGTYRLPGALADVARERREALGLDGDDAGAVLAFSDLVFRAVGREPAWWQAWLADGGPQRPHERAALGQALEAMLAGASDEATLMSVLRTWRRRRLCIIAWRDLAALAPLDETLAALSDMADLAVEAALRWLETRMAERFGTPVGTDGVPQRMVVLGMGKLGGRELNFSSDIDLIFAYPEAGQTVGGPRSIENAEFFRRLGQSLIKVLDQLTEDGFVFRVDMRLRPFGDAGALVAHFAMLEDYYQRHGREWERYAWIKARVIAGDDAAGEQLLARLKPFVYRRYLDFGAIESLREMKALIAREVERKGMADNIKLGPGGIREIEFIAQAFQLIYGGRDLALCERSLLIVLEQLRSGGRLPDFAVEGLKSAYAFLRCAENRIQAFADQQTHALPTDEAGRLRLAGSMGFDGWPAFAETLGRHRRLVAGQFDQIFAAPQTDEAATDGVVDFGTVWQSQTDDVQVTDYLTAQGFADADAALRRLVDLRERVGQRKLGQHGQRRLDQLMPLLLGAVAAVETPDTTLERVVGLLETIAQRSAYLALLVENPMALSQLVKLCTASPWIAAYLGRYPLLLDDLLDPTTLYTPRDRARLERELARALTRVPEGDVEQTMDTLRHFKHTQVLKVAAADVSDALPLMIVSDHLTDIAEVLVGKALALAWADLTARFGRPHCVDAGTTREAAFAVIAYGKFGGFEMGYGSDLDLVFLHDSRGDDQTTDGGKALDNDQFFARLGQRIIHYLTARTAAGELYEVDTRLRPSGRSGLLVSNLDAFATYQRNEAWTWEHQALVRARPVAGSDRLAVAFNDLRREILTRERDAAALREDVRQMRERMRTELSQGGRGRFDIKQDRGGMADIEFITQYLVLANACAEPILTRFTDNVRQLAGLEAVGLLGSWEAGVLRDAYRAMRRQGHLFTLQGQPAVIADGEFQLLRDQVVRIWEDTIGSAAQA